MEYKLIQSVASPHEMEALVNEQLKDGWQLYGNLQVASVSSQREGENVLVALYCQPLTKG